MNLRGKETSFDNFIQNKPATVVFDSLEINSVEFYRRKTWGTETERNHAEEVNCVDQMYIGKLSLVFYSATVQSSLLTSVIIWTIGLT